MIFCLTTNPAGLHRRHGAYTRRLIGLVLCAVVSACGTRAVENDVPQLPQVRIAQIGGTAIAPIVTGVGTVALRRETSLGFTSAGRIARLGVNEGDTVRRGQILAALDTTTVAADLTRATAERERARAEFARSDGLMQQGWITRPRLESARAALLAAEAQVRAAGFQRANATIAAPGPGTVLARLAEPGQVVAAGTPVLVIGEEASGYVLRLPVSDRDAARLTLGAAAQTTLAALDDAVIVGRVIEIAGRADRATGTFAVEIALPDDKRLRSGQIGNARITANGVGATTLAVPPSAVFGPRAGEALVYVVDLATSRVHLRKIHIGEANDAGIGVTGGIKPGEWVALSRVDRLTDGMKVAPLGPAR